MKNIRQIILAIALLSFSFVNPLFSQTVSSDDSFHPYHINYWVTGAIIGVGLTTNYIGIPKVLNKAEISRTEISALNRDIIGSIDSWALRQDPAQLDKYENYSNYAMPVFILMPALLMFDKKIRKDWSDVLLMYVETMSITPNIYEWSFLGPTFQNRFRPVTYYEQLSYEARKSGNNRNSFYSGHVASIAASSFFMAKVYSDFNPEIGNNKYLLYGAATIPPLILGYLRVRALKHFPSDVFVGLGVGALCGILIPELHRFQDKNVKLGLYTSPEGTGLAVQWQPDFLK